MKKRSKSVVAAAPTSSDKPTYATLVTMLRLLMIIYVMFFLILNSWFLVYIDRLESSNCQCAMSTHRRVLQVVLAIMIAVGVAALLFGRNLPLLHVLQSIMIIVNLVYVITAFLFIRRIKREGCSCAQTAAFKVLNIINIFYIAMIALSILAYVGTRLVHRG